MTARCVSWSVQTFDRESADLNDISRFMCNKAVLRYTRRFEYPRNFVFIDMYRNIMVFEKSGDSFNGVSHHGPAHMICVVVAGHHTYNTHSINFGNLQKLFHCVRRVDDDAFP